MILSILVEQIQGEYTGFPQSWYDDDFSMPGAGAQIKPAIAHIELLGYSRSYFLEPEKSQFELALGFSEVATRSATS